MIETETQIFKTIFPPEGAVPLDRLDKVPLIRNHIASIIDLANGHEQRFLRADESAAITAKIVELRDSPGPDGTTPTWETIADICETTIGGARKRYANYKKAQTLATVRKPQIVQQPDPTIREFRIVEVLQEKPTPPPEQKLVSLEYIRQDPPTTGTPIPEQPKTESHTPREAALANLEKLKAEKESKKAESLDPETLAEIDRMLAEGIGVQEISRELGRQGKSVPWTKVRARAAYLARVKGKGNAEMPGETSTEQHKLVETAPLQEAGSEQIESATEQERKPEPVSISRAELDLRIWDMWKAGKTLDEISDILYSEGLYYSAKSVRVRLLNQGAKL